MCGLGSAEAAHAAVAGKEAAEARQAAKAKELETALREASSLFKTEMAVKAAELDALYAELRCPRCPHSLQFHVRYA